MILSIFDKMLDIRDTGRIVRQRKGGQEIGKTKEGARPWAPRLSMVRLGWRSEVMSARI